MISMTTRFQMTVRVSVAQRTEANWRKGGRKTQKSIVKSWDVFQKEALASGKLKHALSHL